MAAGDSAAGIRAGGRGGLAVPRDSFDDGRWPVGAADAGPGCGSRRCNSAGRDHRKRKRKTRTGTVRGGTLVAGELRFPGPPPCVVAHGTGQRHLFRGRLGPALFGFNLTKVAELRNPAARTAGFHPALADKIAFHKQN